jgi:hypothetical protein
MAGALLLGQGTMRSTRSGRTSSAAMGESGDASTGDEHKFHESFLSYQGDCRANPASALRCDDRDELYICRGAVVLY